MKNFSDEEILAAYEQAGEHTRDVIFSTNTTATIGAISTQNGIPEDNMYLVAEEVLFALIGLSGGSETATRLAERLGVGNVQAQQIAHSVFIEIFNKNGIAVSEAKPAAAAARSAPQPAPRPASPQPVRPVQSMRPALESIPASAQPAPMVPTPPAPPPTWAHVQTRPSSPPRTAPQANPPVQAPTTPSVPSYQKPLTQVPQYRNANLYRKPDDGNGQR